MNREKPMDRDFFVTSTTLIGGLRQGDQDAWRRMVHIYGRLVYYWCRIGGVEAAESQDLVQQVFQAVAQKLHTFRRDEPGHSFRAWLRTITKHKVLDMFRKKENRPSPIGGTAGLLSLQQVADQFDQEPDENQLANEMSEIVASAANLVKMQVSEHYWQAFWRTTVDHRDAADVAHELGVSRDVVYKAKSRVLRMLRQQLDGLENLK